jgi:hypothetical protein
MKLNRRWMIIAACLYVFCLFAFAPYVAAGFSISSGIGKDGLALALILATPAPLGLYLWWIVVRSLWRHAVRRNAQRHSLPPRPDVGPL